MSEAAEAVLVKDAILQPLVQRIQLPPLSLTDDVYFRLIRAVVYQQLSGKAAATIFQRFLNLFESEYPNSDHLQALSIEELRAVGLSRQKASYIKNIADYFQAHELFETDWRTWSDEAILNALTSIKGVGKWTVQMILISALGRMDVFPVGDLTIQQCMIQLYGLESAGRELKKEMEQIASHWQPYRTQACRYLWKWKDEQ